MDLFLQEGLRPFSVLAGFIVAALVVEVVLMMVGLSSNIEVDAPGDSLDASFDTSPELIAATVETGTLTTQELALLDLPEGTRAAMGRPAPMLRLLRFAGIGTGPLLVSLTCIAAGLSATGFALQLLTEGVTGRMFPPAIAVALALVPGLFLGGRLAALAARLVPSFESHAISARAYNGRRGHVVIGDARRGDAAQVRWRDMHGTTHSLMAEPLRDGEVIPAGTEVLIVKTRERQPRIVPLDTD